MITRLWHGWTSRENADAYENYLRAYVLPGIHRVEGYRGAYLLRREDGAEIAFVTLTFFDSMDAVRAFAGDDYEVAVVPPKAQKLLSHYDARAVHYDTVIKQD
jgi:heme-degrading monooxygenase HmoA